MLSDNPFVAFAIMSPRYYETLDRYVAQPHYRELVEPALGEGWTIQPRGFWTLCRWDVAPRKEHAWKIHVSSALATAEETLKIVSPILAHHRVSFKFVSDRRMLTLSLTKNWSQAQAGKFVAVYPTSNESFSQLLEELTESTKGLDGPYILSDRAYRTSNVVFYRYGEHDGRIRPSERGALRHGFYTASGEWHADERTPYFRLPPGISDPIGGEEPAPVAAGATIPLKGGRYAVERPIKFNADGGIYAAVDTETGGQVVIREARPFLGPQQGGSDSFALLQKEARILRQLEHTGYLPKFIDLFLEWKHLFLVQEFLDAESLWGTAIGFYFTPGCTPTDAFRAVHKAIHRICEGLAAVHQHGVILRDLTKNNVMVTHDGAYKFIDLEFAYELGRDDSPIPAFTAGYASPEQLKNQLPTVADDYYSLGALILDMISFTAAGYPLNPDGIRRALRSTLADLGLPVALAEVTEGLMEANPALRWTPERALRHLAAAETPSAEIPMFVSDPVREPPSPDLWRRVNETLTGIEIFLRQTADFDRLDRVWPTAPEVFSANPLSMQYGAAGPMLFLASRNAALDRLEEWCHKALDRHTCPPGLYSGYGGLAVVLTLFGYHDLASRACELLETAEPRRTIPGLYYGEAGIGLAYLNLWLHSRDDRFLKRATACFEYLSRTAVRTPEGVYWQTHDVILLGFGEGQSGVATFLSYYAAIAGDASGLDLARDALDFDWAYRQDIGTERLLWYSRTDATPNLPKSPHTWFGTCGVGTGMLRYYMATGDCTYLERAEACAKSVQHRYTNKIGQNYGLAGFGELALDLYGVLGDDRHYNTACYYAEGLLPFAVPDGDGIAFPGDNLVRLSADFGMGSAGIGLFLQRLMAPTTTRPFMPDYVFARRVAPTTAPLGAANYA